MFEESISSNWNIPEVIWDVGGAESVPHTLLGSPPGT